MSVQDERVGDTHAADADRIALAALIREVGASGISAALAGVIAGGLLGRVVMRVSALLNPSLAGIRTDNGNRIGEITAGGTIGLIIFGGVLLGVMGAVVWVAARPWLPKRPGIRHATAGIIAVGAVGFIVVEADNIDFLVLDPPWAHVVMFTGVVAAAGALTSWIDIRLVPQWRRSKAMTIPAVIIVGNGALLSVPALLTFLTSDFCNCDHPPRVAGALFCIALAITVAAWVLRMRSSGIPRRMVVAARLVTAGAVVAGLVHLAGQVNAIV